MRISVWNFDQWFCEYPVKEKKIQQIRQGQVHQRKWQGSLKKGTVRNWDTCEMVDSN